MAKFARPEEKSFSPLNLELIEEATEPTLPPPESSKPPAPRQAEDIRTKVVALMTGVENHQPEPSRAPRRWRLRQWRINSRSPCGIG